ncbi:PRC-barrel domain-containing protein [Candidatus Nitrospira nitrificans]|uniref:PRC-barrel domain protein (Modular protein) n=1 Tax=Candidatus Nitrospira nitrificans TaxID=1742973 RepID=A0A0S4LQK3_9BACT|nr:PRC-barrel domain-containing protein [Candidatus Nitrospira nitrificans]CUS39793.1 PRC-barrel domain protein (modular protein) [Candidatus Nitrospira nitrificans]
MKKEIVTCAIVAGLLLCAGQTSWADHTLPDIVKGTKIIGKPVQNLQGRNLGKIEDFAIDEIDGSVRYAVLSFGGVLGLGEKYFAIPWEALTLSNDRKHFVLDLEEKVLTQAPGFNKDKWPDFADPDYHVTIYEFYNIPVRASKEQDGVVVKERAPAGVTR